MKRFWGTIRYSSVSVMLAGVGSAITGCTAEDAIKALLIWLALALGGGTAADETTSGTPAAPQITMYDGGVFNGDLRGAEADGRAGADLKCTNAAGPLGLAGKKIHAYISVNGADDIKTHAQFPDLPLTVPIKSTTGVQIATDWDEAIDTVSSPAHLDVSLWDAAIIPLSNWWSGSNRDGTAGPTCDAWITGTFLTPFTSLGQVGRSDRIDAKWLTEGSGDGCNVPMHLLCVAY